jgi:hypothetical protein
MSRLTKSAKRKTRSKAVPVLGVAGMTFFAGACAALAHPSLEPATDSARNKMVLGEEEISDITLATFYAGEHEGQNQGQAQSQGRTRRIRLAMGACGCGCGGCGGCWGGNYYGYGPPPVFNDAYAPPEPIRPVRKYRRTYRRTDYRKTWRSRQQQLKTTCDAQDQCQNISGSRPVSGRSSAGELLH